MWNCNWYNIGTGDNETIIRVFGEYIVNYIPTLPGVIRYARPDTIAIVYVEPKKAIIEYKQTEEGVIRYVKKPTIKIEMKCK